MSVPDYSDLLHKITSQSLSARLYLDAPGIECAETMAQAASAIQCLTYAARFYEEKAEASLKQGVVTCGECVHRVMHDMPMCEGRRPDWFCASAQRIYRVHAPAAKRGQILRAMSDTELAAYLENELADSQPVDWLAWLQEAIE